MQEVYYRTPVGIALIVAEDGYITKVSIRDEELEETTTDSPILLEAIKQLREYFEGERKDFDLPIKQPGSSFQQEVWQQLLQIKYGSTITYLQQSQLMKNPLAIRAIAAANGKNNLWIVVPCHRVIGSNGSLTGYAGGLWRKQWLLEHEARVMGTGQTKLPF
ncbi:methylated-DNA--[protein]-cysteine S-methyltransferase [Mucilaginibacter sp.]|jgi:methylated-DNA-[protein]-cysteine S-methyltransferase|uniref:methylated-DNA--[protein]-cysteine S-methyltransferase n=1 Tax=Mucilaginibacter sp. TaxID=1882438 RepID=UPI0035644513